MITIEFGFHQENTSIDASFTYNDQLPAPYGACVKHPKYDSIWSLDGQKLEYTQTACQLAVVQDYVIKHCKCVLHPLDVHGYETIDQNLPNCNSDN